MAQPKVPSVASIAGPIAGTLLSHAMGFNKSTTTKPSPAPATKPSPAPATKPSQAHATAAAPTVGMPAAAAPVNHYPHNTFSATTNCTIVSTAKMIPSPRNASRSCTTDEFLMLLVGRPGADKISRNNVLDSFRTAEDIEIICDEAFALETDRTTIGLSRAKMFADKPKTVQELMSIRIFPVNKLFAIGFSWFDPQSNNWYGHAVNGIWDGKAATPRFTDYQLDEKGQDCTAEVLKWKLIGIWYWEKD